MKNFIKVLLFSIFIVLLGFSFYFGYLFYSFEDPNIQITRDINDKRLEIKEIDEKIAQTKQEIETIIENNKYSYTELENWQRHKEKLEKALAQ